MKAHEKVIGYLWPSGNMYRDLPAGSCDADRALVERCIPLMYATPAALAADELLEVLKHALRWHDQLSASDIEKMRLAIAKATTSNAPDFANAYEGAREDMAIWKKRALEAEELNRKFIREINGPTFMGEPVTKPHCIDGACSQCATPNGAQP